MLAGALASSRHRTLATRRATLYFCPSFSNSAMTQSVMCGTHCAYRQSIIPFTRSILFLMEKLMKFVSTITLYGGPSAELCLKNSAEDVASLRWLFDEGNSGGGVGAVTGCSFRKGRTEK